MDTEEEYWEGCGYCPDHWPVAEEYWICPKCDTEYFDEPKTIDIGRNEILPVSLGRVEAHTDEMMFYLYLPVKMADGEYDPANLPKRLSYLQDLLNVVLDDADTDGKYVYVTAKHTYVSPQSMSNRMGVHIDGFGTDDINYIWYTEAPTEFFVQKMTISTDDRQSMIDMEAQVKDECIVTYDNRFLLKLSGPVVHRVSENTTYEGMRTFIKISVSKYKYNLLGNSINHLMDYDWKMYSREELRNMENNSDMVK